MPLIVRRPMEVRLALDSKRALLTSVARHVGEDRAVRNLLDQARAEYRRERLHGSRAGLHQELQSNNVIFRIPTPVFGAGLIEQIPDSAILANMSSNGSQKSALGIKGKANFHVAGARSAA